MEVLKEVPLAARLKRHWPLSIYPDLISFPSQLPYVVVLKLLSGVSGRIISE